VRPAGVVMVNVDPEHTFEVAAAADQDPVKTLSSHGPDAALGVSVGLWCSDGRADDVDFFAVEDLVEAARELAVAVTNQILDGCRSFAQPPDEVARLLGYPLAVWPCGGAGEVQAAAVELEEEEHVEPAKRDRLDRKEVDGENASRLCAEELTPREAAAIADRSKTVIAQDLAD
jgi:hypothetical protein